MQLSKNFTLFELTKSTTAKRRGLDNTPPPEIIPNLKAVAVHILQPVRDRYGISFSPESGYRSKAVNSYVGGSDNSDHIKGCAVDFEVAGVNNFDLAVWIRDHLTFDQLILEFYTPGIPHSGWIHCSYRRDRLPRKQVLTAIPLSGGGVAYKGGLIR